MPDTDAIKRRIIESHPFNHLGLGELPYLILVRYPRGARDQDRVVQLLREHSCKKSCCINHLSGEFDLGVWVWIPAGRLEGVLGLVKSALGAAEMRVYPIQRLSTPFQRDQDVPDVRPILFERHFSMQGGLWTPDPRSTGFRAVDFSSKVKFYTVITTRPGESTRVFRSLLEKFSKGAKDEFEHFTICTYKSEIESGCIVTAYCATWGQKEPALLGLLDGLPNAAHSTTYLCFRALVDNDEPWVESRDSEQAPSIVTLKLRAMRAITGTFGYRDRDPRHAVPRIEALFTDDEVARSLLTYAPEYWWDFRDNVSTLIADVITGTGERFAGILLKQYTKLERQLCDGIRRLFSVRRSSRGGSGARTVDALILSGLVGAKFEDDAEALKQAIEWVRCRLDLHRSDREQLRRWIGRARRNYLELVGKQAHLTLGVIPQVISAMVRRRLFPTTKYLNFSRNPLMHGWEVSLLEMARDRDLLAHGQVDCAFDLDDTRRPYWERLLPNYIRAYPQSLMLLRELSYTYEGRCKTKPVKLPLAPKRSESGDCMRKVEDAT